MSHLQSTFDKFIEDRSLVSLPGGFGTTLQLQGYRFSPESWSGEANLKAPNLLELVHRSFHDAYVDIHTTNTFRTSTFFMNKVVEQFNGCADNILRDCRDLSAPDREFSSVAEELSYWASKRAVDAALNVQASSDRLVWVGGSVGPINDTHSHNPDTAIPLKDLRHYHAEHTRLLHDLGTQVLFVETLPTLHEVIAASEAAAATGLPYVVSLVLNEHTGRLFDGSTIQEAVRETINPSAILFNCTPMHVIGQALDELLDCFDGVVGAYPNGGGGPASDKVHWDHVLTPEAIDGFTNTLAGWRAKSPRVKFLGGCCGAAPSYIHALNQNTHSGFHRPGTRAATETEGHKHTASCGGHAVTGAVFAPL